MNARRLESDVTRSIQRVSTGDLIASKIRAMIFDGTLRPGDRLWQGQLARELGVSRIPVREAFIALEREGWVTMSHNRGTFVESFDEEAVRVHFEVRGLICALAARRTATKGSAESRACLRGAHERLLTSSTSTELQDAHHEFLRELISATQSPRLEAVWQSHSNVLPHNFSDTIPGIDVVQRRGCEQIATAIERRDGQDAADACIALVAAHAELMVEALHARGVLPTGPERAALTPPHTRRGPVLIPGGQP
jgi:DNA-binding GntR family transcriptional regulator